MDIISNYKMIISAHDGNDMRYKYLTRDDVKNIIAGLELIIEQKAVAGKWKDSLENSLKQMEELHNFADVDDMFTSETDDWEKYHDPKTA